MIKIKLQKNESLAVSKFIRMSPSKIRRVLRQIQGKTYFEALLLLKFLPYASCVPIIKVLRSSVANGKKKLGFNKKQLKVKSAIVNRGPVIKRFRQRAQGRAYRILKTTSHITIVVEKV